MRSTSKKIMETNISTLGDEMNKYRYMAISAAALLLTICFGCGDSNGRGAVKTAQDEMIPPPYFTEINWPDPFTELQQGRLVITGNLQSPAGYFEEQPIAIEMYAVPLIDPPLPEFTNPPPTQQELQIVLLNNQTVQQWVAKARNDSFRRITEGPFVGADHWSDFTKGAQSWALFSESFDDDNYLDFETGDFEIDFDQTKRLMPVGAVLIFLIGQDQTGLISIAMNIYSVPQVLSPEIIDSLDDASIAYASSLTGLGDDLNEVLAVSGDDRSVDIALIAPFLTLIDEVYGEGYSDARKAAAAEHLRTSGALASSLIAETEYREIYRAVVDYIAEDYAFFGFACWSRHYMNLPAGVDYIEAQEDAIQEMVDDFNRFSEQYVLTERGGGVKELSVQVNEGENVVAQFTIIGDPENPLVVTGYIGEHTIVPDDYNPYIAGLLGVFESEGYVWPASSI